MYSRKSVGPPIEPWGTPALIDVLVKTSHPEPPEPKPSITEKRRNKAKHLT